MDFCATLPGPIGNIICLLSFDRLNELVNTGDSIAVLDSGMAFGGGTLQNHGINSNTSANGFIKCLYKKVVTPNAQPVANGKE